MKEYHIARNGIKEGPYPEWEVRRKLQAGEISPQDLCWTDGMTEWEPVGETIRLPPPLPEEESSAEPWFLYIPPMRLLMMNLISFGLYQTYWIYKNYRYLNARYQDKYMPFLRAIFGIFFMHTLLRRIREDRDLNSREPATFSSGLLASGWVILILLGNLLNNGKAAGVISGMMIYLFAVFFIMPVQQFINRANQARAVKVAYSPWSFGHWVVLLLGLSLWALVFFVEPPTPEQIEALRKGGTEQVTQP